MEAKWAELIGDLPDVVIHGFGPPTYLPTLHPNEAICSSCGKPLVVLGGHRFGFRSGDREERRVGWLCWARCDACGRFYTQRLLPKPSNASGWQFEPAPPSYIQNLGRSDVQCQG
jgi:hypothetical protein